MSSTATRRLGISFRPLAWRNLSGWLHSIGRFIESVLLTPAVYLKGRLISGRPWTLQDTAIFVLLGLFTWFGIMTLNDLSDGHTDANNPGKTLHRWLLDLLPRHVWFLVIAVVCALIVCSVGWLGGWAAFGLLLVFQILSYLYSFGPRLKEWPIVDSLVGGSSHALIFLMGQILGQGKLYWFGTFWFGVKFFAFHACTAMVDYEIDRRAKVQTSSVTFGPDVMSLLISVIICADLYLYATPATEQGRVACLVIALVCHAVIMVTGAQARWAKRDFTAPEFLRIRDMSFAACIFFFASYLFGLWH